MSQIDDATDGPGGFAAGRTLWRRCLATEAGVDESERFLDLAAFADGLLDDDEHERVAALVTADPVAAADVEAARALTAGGAALPVVPDAIVARAVAIGGLRTAWGQLLRFPPRPAKHPGAAHLVERLAQWGGLAAAIAVTGWLGFAMGSGASLRLVAPAQPYQLDSDSLLPELLDPGTGFLREFEGRQT